MKHISESQHLLHLKQTRCAAQYADHVGTQQKQSTMYCAAVRLIIYIRFSEVIKGNVDNLLFLL